MRVVTEAGLGAVRRGLPGDPRVVTSGNFATSPRALGVLDAAVSRASGRRERLTDVHRAAVPFDRDAAYHPVQPRRAVCGTLGDRVAPDPGGIRDEPGTLVAGESRGYGCMDQPSGPAALLPSNGASAVTATEPDAGQQCARPRADRRAARQD
jgi:hypothetical protein